MAQSGYTPIQLYRTATPAAAPVAGNLAAGELAINTADGKIYYKDASNNVQVIATKDAAGGSFTTVNATNLEVTNLKAKDGTAAGSIANSTGVVTLASSVLTTTDINGGTIDGVTIGGATPAAGSFTTLSANSTVTFSGLNASQAVFTNGSDELVSNAITGTGNVVMSASPTLTGTITAAAITASGTITGNGNWVIGSDSADTVTINGTPTVNAPTVISANSASDALRITQTGSGNALLVEDSANPDATPFVIAGDGSVIKGSLSLYPSLGATPLFQVNGTGVGDSTFAVNSWRNSSASGALIALNHSKSGTVGTFGTLASGDSVGSLVFSGDDGTSFVQAASISAAVDGTPGTNDMPGRLVFSTTADGASSPTERMRIDSAGRVGIGASSPVATLDVNGDISTVYNSFIGSNLYFDYSTVQWKYRANGYAGAIKLSEASAGAIQFLQAGNNTGGAGVAATIIERMRIDSAGNVGIGTSSPSVLLDVNKTGGQLRVSDGTVDMRVLPVAASNVGITGTLSNHAYVLYSNNAERLRITTSGDVGIGTASPAYRLDVVGEPRFQQAAEVFAFIDRTSAGANNNFVGNITFRANNASSALVQYAKIFAQQATTTAGSQSGRLFISAQRAGTQSTYINADGNADVLIFQTTDTERMRIDSSGNVGIGTSSPQQKLHVYNGASGGTRTAGVNTIISESNIAVGLQFLSPNTTAQYIFFGDPESSQAGRIVYEHANNAMAFNTDSSERARIDSSGNLLVGTTNSSGTAGAGFKLTDGGQVPVVVSAYTTNANSSYVMYSTGAAAYRFFVRWDGVIQATSTTIVGTSDQRLKENVRDLDDGLTKIMELKPRRFDWKAGKGRNVKDDRGWIAQEFGEVFPDMVDTSPDPVPEGEEPYKTVRADLLPVLVKAIQEQQALIESLTARVAQLEGK